MSQHEEKVKNLIHQFNLLKKNKHISLKSKQVTHFFRRRQKPNPLDLRVFNQVIAVNTEEHYVEVEGLATFYDIVEETLKLGFMPAVVPELRNITIGGAISGLGVEASSFKYGLVHENVFEIELLTGNGDSITCSADKNADIFAALPNSLGTLGYILKCKMTILPVQKFVQVELFHFSNVQEYFTQMQNIVKEQTADFIEGVIFDLHTAVLIQGTFVSQIPKEQEIFDVYTQPWYRYLENTKKTSAYFTIKDFFWRWDADAYWGTNRDGVIGWALNTQILRKTILRSILRSDRLLAFGHLLKYSTFFSTTDRLIYGRQEQMVQDLGIDLAKCAEFILWYQEIITIYPIWLCPVRVAPKENYYPLYLPDSEYVVDIGFYSSKRLAKEMSDHHYTTLLEQKIKEMHAMKGLHTTSFYSVDDFWAMFDKERYFTVKKTYDPDNVFPDLYEKAVGKLTK